jgi:hypothetical protein
MTPTADSLQGFRNRIINGDMRIDQRNAGASVTITAASASQFTLDRFYLRAESASGSKISVQRSAVAPTGFTNSMLLTSLSAYTLGASEHFATSQPVEGFNVADLGWGTASAQTITVSFWVRSSLTGTFGGGLVNGAGNRCFIYSYTINAANTWEQKTITVPGDTTGTWLTDNGVGLYLNVSVGAGSSVTSAAGSWSGTFARSVTGQTSLVGTSGATFYITGVQLEAGSVATPFERRDYGRELMLCQRYFFSVNAIGTSGSTINTTAAMFTIRPPVTMRATPTTTYANQNRITYPSVIDYSGVYTGANRTLSPDTIGFTYTQSSGSTFTQNVPVILNDTAVSCVITGSAEL